LFYRVPEQKKQRYRNLALGMEEAGRWTLVRPLVESPTLPADETGRGEALEHIAGTLLKRYGVVFRALLTREHVAPPWLNLLPVYRRLEARGDIRGGRFVAGHFGEQFALPEAVETLRQVRKQNGDATLKAAFTPVAAALAAAEKQIVAELIAVQGKPVDLGGYYRPNDAKASAALRPSATFNRILAQF
jgi:hypothetical protein